jgi:ATP-binding cassette subfamily F protein uup
MSLLVARGVEMSFGERQVLRGCDLVVDAGECVGLVGVNGCGKSTLLAILAGLLEPDHGEVELDGTAALLRQEPLLQGQTVGEAAAVGVGWHRRLLADYEQALADGDLDRSASLQGQLDEHGWTVEHRIDAILDRLHAPPRDALCATLSGGEKRRVALARTLLEQPDLLLLDEPTNHLDTDTVDWLQAHLAAWKGAAVLVTHDRYLLEAVATRIVEVEDGECISYDGSYGDYLVARVERQALLQRTEDVRLAYIAREAEWAARSPAARTTKSKSRLQRLEALRAKRPIRRDETFELDLATGDKSGRTVLEFRQLSHGYGDRELISNFDFSVMAGERIGIVGPNGCGKSTLLRLIAGQEQPRSGEVILGGRIRPAMLDQHRTGLDLTDTVFEAAGGGSDWVTVGGRRIHVVGFLQRFLFRRDVLGQKVAKLSGGERARLLLARLLLEGANLLLLDEPTNDLDLLTLRVLEEALMSFDGSTIVVTHDRAFLDRTCTGILAFVGDGELIPFSSRAQVSRHAAQRRKALGAKARAEKSGRRQDAARGRRETRAANQPRKLSFAEKQEYEALPARIEGLEGEQAQVEATLGDPTTYEAGSEVDVAALTARLSAIPEELKRIYERWEELEALQ